LHFDLTIFCARSFAARDEKGYSALHWAAYFEEAEVLARLLGDARLESRATAQNGHTALHTAALMNSTRCLQRLLNGGLDAGEPTSTAWSHL
jgi:ankyrin repeat protein